jgi:hypothetical protein
MCAAGIKCLLEGGGVRNEERRKQISKQAPVHLFIFIDNSYTGTVLFNVHVSVMRNDKGSSQI